MDIEQIRSLTPLEPLPSRVYFVCKALGRWADVLEGTTRCRLRSTPSPTGSSPTRT